MQSNEAIRPVNGAGHTTGKSPRDYLTERARKATAEKRRAKRQAAAKFVAARKAQFRARHA